MKTPHQRSSLIPDEPPPPELTAAVRTALGLDRQPKPTMADGLPEGMTDADPPVDQGLKLPDPLRVGPPRPADETMPAFGPIGRVNLGALAKMGWLTTRLMLRFPHIAEHQWSGRLRMYIVDNAFQFICSEHAAALATVVRDPFRPKAYVQLLFCMHSEQGQPTEEKAVGERECLLLLREIVRWAKMLGADEVHRLNEFCDLAPSMLDKITGSERREEIIVRIR